MPKNELTMLRGRSVRRIELVCSGFVVLELVGFDMPWEGGRSGLLLDVLVRRSVCLEGLSAFKDSFLEVSEPPLALTEAARSTFEAL